MADNTDVRTGDGKGTLNAATGLVSSDKIKEIAGNKGEPKSSQVSEKEPDDQSQSAQKNDGSQQNQQSSQTNTNIKKDSSDNDEIKTKGTEPIVVKTPFGSKVFGGSKDDSGDEIKFNSFEDVQKFGKQFGVELNKPEDLQSFFKEYSNLQQVSSKTEKIEKELNNYRRNIQSLPEEVLAIITAALNGQDYVSVIKNVAERGVFNYDRSFDSYNERELINHYSSKKYTKEDFDEMDPDQYAALREMAKVRYETAQTAYKNKMTLAKQATDAQRQKFENSVESSIARLKSNNPDMGEDKIQRVREIMTQELHSTLFNEDNTYKPEAAEKIAMLEFGKDAILAQEHTIADLVEKYVNQGKTQATEAIIQASDRKKIKGSSTPDIDQKIAEVVKRQVSFLHPKNV